MSGYRIVNIDPWCNVSSDWDDKEVSIPAGHQTLRGLPFRIGKESDKTSHFVGFGKGGHREPIEVPLACSAQWLIFAHRLSESHIYDGDPVGKLVATYRICYNNQEVEEIQIRERFEISVVPPDWGQLPLLAMPDNYETLFPREDGSWDLAGQRQRESIHAWPRWFVLWAWQNPYPENDIASLIVAPGGPKFIIGGISISNLEEDPLGREERVPLKISLLNSEQKNQNFNLSVNVDRGVATYPHPLPRESGEEFLNSIFLGWGQPSNDKSSPAYVEIAALPSATVRFNQGQEELASVNWKEVLTRTLVEKEDVRIELINRGKNWVHVTVLDEDTGKPLPCRIHFRSPEGIPYQPHGHHNHILSDKDNWHIDVGGDVRLGHVTYAYINGRCQGWLPRGKVFVDVARGFEYKPLRTEIDILPGQTELTLKLKRRLNLNSERWFSGDTHVHFLSTSGGHLEAQGEDLNVVNILQSQWGHLFTNTEDFVGYPQSSQDGKTIVYISQENRQHILGHLTLLGLKEPVMPWCSDGPGEAEMGGSMETTLSHWADECHAQGGLVIMPHFPTPNCESATLISTGRVDAVEMLRCGNYEHLEYYRYLNGGYRLPLVGGTDKMTSMVPVGLYRTYVYIPPDQEFNYVNWCNNLALGRTFISSGPVLRFTIDGFQIGDTLHLPGNGGNVEIEAHADSIFPIHTLEIVQEGHIVASTEDIDGVHKLTLKTKLHVDQNTWIAARVGGSGYNNPLLHFDEWSRGIMAHTSPIYIAVGEEWWMYNRETAQYMLTLNHGGIEYIDQLGRRYPHGNITHHHRQEDHLAYLSEPFHEAEKIINERLNKSR